MRLRILLLVLLSTGFLHAQENVYCRYESDGKMGIHLAIDDDHLNEVSNPISEKYEFIEAFYFFGKSRAASNYFLIFKDQGKMGVLNAKGKVMIPAIYDTIQRFERWAGESMTPFQDFFHFRKDGRSSIKHIRNLKNLFDETYDKIVYDDMTGDLRCYNAGRVRFICRNGEELFPETFFVEIGPSCSMNYPYDLYVPPIAIIAKEEDKPMKVYSDKGTFNNDSGAVLLSFTFERMNDETKLLVFATVNGKMGLMDENGGIRIPFLYDSLVPIFPWFEDGRVHRMVTIDATKEGLIDLYNRELYPAEFMPGSFTENETYYNEGIFIVSKDTMTQQGLFDINGTVLIPVQTQTIKEVHHNGDYSEHNFEVKRDDLYGRYTAANKVGIYDSKGREIIPCAYFMIHDANSVDHRAEEPNFIKFNSHEEWLQYWNGPR